MFSMASYNIEYKVLATGKLPYNEGTIYKAEKETLIKYISLACGVVSCVINMKLIKKNGEVAYLVPINMSFTAGYFKQALDPGQELQLGIGDMINAQCSVSDNVSYGITGALVEVDQFNS